MKILVGDDEHTTVQVIKSALEKAGHQVLVAFDGMQIARLARLERPDLILLDIIMPGLDGTLVAGNLARMPDTMTIPIIFLSSQAPEDAAIRGDLSRGRAYLQKPIKVQLLLDEVQRVLTGQQTVSAEEVISDAPGGPQTTSPVRSANEAPPVKFDF